MDTQDKIKSCLTEGARGAKHKGLRKIAPSRELMNGHIKKAIHNFNAIDLFSKFNYKKNCAKTQYFSLEIQRNF